MKMRRLTLMFAPMNRAYKITESFNIAEVRDYLEQYLNDEFGLLNNYELVEPIESKSKRRRKKKKSRGLQSFSLKGLSDNQILVICAAVIGYRVVKKYCRGERPHWERAAIWKKSLYIMDYLERIGQLTKKELRFYLKDGYLFLCRVYNDVEGIGTVILPETKGCRFSDWIPVPDGSDDVPGPFYDMPPLLGSTNIIAKKEAAKRISEFVFESRD